MISFMLRRIKNYISLDSSINISKDLTFKGDLNYYLDFTAAQDEEFFRYYQLGDDGVPISNYRHGPKNNKAIKKAYNFTTVCLYALLNLEKFLQTNLSEYRDIFFKQIGFLIAKAKYHNQDMAVWETEFDWMENNTLLKAPFADAMNQGLAISALVRAHRLTGNQDMLDLALSGAGIFSVSIQAGGIKAVENGMVFYEEYPAYPLTYVLDGMCFGLLGLYDLYVITNNELIRSLFEDGVKGIEHRLSLWDYNGYWSGYGNYRKVSGIMYNKVNACMLKVLGAITSKEKLKETGQRWLAENLRFSQRMDIYLQLARIKLWEKPRDLGIR